MRMKAFLKNEDKKKYKYNSILTYIFFIYNYLIIFKKSYNKLFLKNVLRYLNLCLIL